MSSGGGEVAIVGMSCLFAGAPGLDAYWRNIISKVDAVTDPGPDEWDAGVFYDADAKSNDRVYCKRGGYLGNVSEFRPMDFGIMPVAVDGGEPDQWLALRVAHEALADAGYKDLPPEHERAEVVLGKGTYVNRGNLVVGYHGMIIDFFLQALRNLHPEYTDAELGDIRKEIKSSLPPFSADTAPALIGNIIAGRIANRLDFMGPSFTVDAACASALLAIEIGVRDLLSHKYDLVLAGGANVNAPLPTMGLFCQLGALSRREQIRPFDKDADGTILGEGIGMIVLKRREDAERDGNRIYALIKGVGVASDGRAVHVMAPRVEGEELALRRAYEMAGVGTDTVGLIEAHGTATPLGDVVELQALGRVFGERRAFLPNCAIGSVKSMIGHTMPAAGIAGVIKTALALYHKVLPPTLHCEEPNPALNLDKSPFYVNTEARPWIHGADTPRRAGVNAFGFGGINGHAVLEEYPSEDPSARSHLLEWETELCVLEAGSRSALAERCTQLIEFLARSADLQLKDLAYTLNSRLRGESARLAVIASTTEDLAQKLSLALRRLNDPKSRQIKDNSGIYFFDQPVKGKLAFLFPGEGAQYPNMLADLCLHFPEVRSCFDLADRALRHGLRDMLPSELIFPRSLLSNAERTRIDEALWHIDGAVEAVLIGNSAIWTLLNKLEIRPDVILGHSTGEYSAMLASKIINLPDEAYVETIVAWNKTHARLSGQMQVPPATLVAVAADAATVQQVVDEVGHDLHLAMDNCPHQTVLVGSKEAAELAIEHLRSRGVIYEVLPFDRPYHTPLFQAYAQGAGDQFFSSLPVGAPRVETYSCTTAAPYPPDVDGIRELFVAHWVRPVLFTQTIRKMYDEGVRLFVEAGPRGNLTAFVSDILRGKPHLAMPANLPRRSGVTQLNHLAGILLAHGVSLKTDYLYQRRNPKIVEWESESPTQTKKQTGAMKLALSLPPIKVAPRAKTETPRTAPPAVPPPSRVMAAQATAGTASPQARVMQDYLKSMEQFLQMETQVMGAYLERARQPQAAQPAGELPLLGKITSMVPGQSLTSVRELSLEHDLFLRDHALGNPVSTTDASLQPLIILPLTMGMEILAEAASALMPGLVLTEMRDIQASQWIQVDQDSPARLEIRAQLRANSQNEVEVQVRKATGALVVQGAARFAREYPAPPAPSRAPFESERTSTLSSARLYGSSLMFHGPSFQGVASVDRSGQNGVAGRLRVLPSTKLFRSNTTPRFITDPVLLDAAGQLVGFWSAEYLQRGFVVFPYHLHRLHIYGPNRPAGQVAGCRVTLKLNGNDTMRSDIEITGADGAVWMQLQGWADRRFDPPPRFYRAWITPRESMLSEMCEAPANSACCRLSPPFEPGPGLWKELWASLVLTREERQIFRGPGGTESEQLQWLTGRTAAKDAVRTFVRKRYGIELLPADIGIGSDEHGKLVAQGPWTHQVSAVPELSITYSGGAAVALAGERTESRNV